MASPISSHAGFSTTSDDEVEWCLVECTGFEKVAREEAMEVLCVEDVQVGQGNIVIRMPMKETPKRPLLPVDVFRLDACRLPLTIHSVDVFITDLPFGKRIGSRKDNWRLYPAVMYEMARVAKLSTGRACLLTQDKKCMFKCMQHFTKYWKKQSYLWVNIGGLIAGVWVFRRTAAELAEGPVPTLWHAPVPADCPQEMPVPDNQLPKDQKTMN